MKNYIFLLLTILFFSACSNKHLTIKALYPSNITEQKVSNIFVDELKNDNINQMLSLKNELINKTIDNKKVFYLQKEKKDADLVIEGEVLNSSLNSTFYYEEDFNNFRCLRYVYIDSAKTATCVEYARILIPCERRDYQVETQIKALNQNNNIIFSKIYSKSKIERECYRYPFSYSPFFYNRINLNYTRAKTQVNSKLAKKIAIEILEDISPHYIYQKIQIIDKLNNKYKKSVEEEFNDSILLLTQKKVKEAKQKLEKLNSKLNYSSYEVLYNLALTYEAENFLEQARLFYYKANKICKNIDDLKLINKAINRVNKNIINKQKAKLQLDSIQKY
jgi:hypothetical protein